MKKHHQELTLHCADFNELGVVEKLTMPAPVGISGTLQMEIKYSKEEHS